MFLRLPRRWGQFDVHVNALEIPFPRFYRLDIIPGFSTEFMGDFGYLFSFFQPDRQHWPPKEQCMSYGSCFQAFLRLALDWHAPTHVLTA